jgi:hypothetical protein
MRTSRRFNISILLVATFSACASGAQTTANFSGAWKQSNERCVPKRSGEVTLHIDHRDPELIVETSILRGSAAPRHATQHYTTNGMESVSTGADGDEFHTSIVWNGRSLVFSVEEHEDWRIIRTKETWTLIEDGAALERIRERLDGGEKQTLIYQRQF